MEYTEEQIEQILNVNPRWLPPSPHREKIAEWVRGGACHVVHRGHGQSPLLVFDDGGAMALPTVRWAETERGWRLVSEGEDASATQTRHLDVCGSLDEFKRLLVEDPDNEVMPRLLADVEHMIARLTTRRNAYCDFASEVIETAQAEVRGPKRYEDAAELLPKLNQYLDEDPQWISDNLDAIYDEVERVRDVAQFLEYALADYKEMALKLNSLYRAIKGGRNWDRYEQANDE